MTRQLHNQRGQALPEMLIVFPIVVIFVMGLLQIALLYRGKATLNNATFQAARVGALNHAYISEMTPAFFDRMAALGHVTPQIKANSTISPAGLYEDPDQVSLAKMRAAVKASHTYTPIEVEWPTRDIFRRFAVRHRDLEPCSGWNCPFSGDGGRFRLSYQSVLQMPFDNLDARRRALVNIGGRRIDLQDANLLRIRSLYCYPLEVPVANFIIWQALRTAQSSNTDWQSCQAAGARFGEDSFVIPLRGHSIVRMQSGIRCEDDEYQGRDCRNL